MSSPTAIPQITIQPTYPTVLADVISSLVPAEDIWISCYKEGAQSVHSKVRVTKSRDAEGGVKLDARDGVEVEWVSSSVLKVSCPRLNIPLTTVRFPRQTIPISKSTPPTQITSLSPAPDLSVIATGHPDGHVSLTSITSSAPQQTFTPHVSDVLTIRILPSSKVILSAGSDCRLQILPVTTPFNAARTLTAHKRAVTDTAVLGRGRELLSCAKDGTLRWWDVPQGKVKRTIPLPSYAAAFKMAALVPPAELDLSNVSPSPTEPLSETTPLVAVALSSSVFTLIDMRAPVSPAYTSSKPDVPSPLHAIAMHLSPSSSLHVTTGSRSGILSTHDLRSPTAPLYTVRRNGSSIEDIAPLDGGDLAVGTEDGLPWRLGTGSSGAEVDVREEWAGYECDAVRCVRVEGGSVWMGGDDGVVRRY